MLPVQHVLKAGRGKLYAGAIIVLVAAAAFLAMPAITGMPGAVKIVKGIYEIRAGMSEINRTEEVSGIYKITVSFQDAAGKAVSQDAYITKDGKYMIGNIIDAEILKKALINEKKFAQCLVDNKVVVLGSSSDTNSISQLQSLGIVYFSYSSFYDCSANVQVCQQLGVTTLPTLRIGSQNYPGLQTPQFVQEKTGCVLNATA